MGRDFAEVAQQTGMTFWPFCWFSPVPATVSTSASKFVSKDTKTRWFRIARQQQELGVRVRFEPKRKNELWFVSFVHELRSVNGTRNVWLAFGAYLRVGLSCSSGKFWTGKMLTLKTHCRRLGGKGDQRNRHNELRKKKWLQQFCV